MQSGSQSRKQKSATRRPTGPPRHDACLGAEADRLWALEVTWPEGSGLEPWQYDPWTVAAHWAQALVDKVQGFGGVLVQRTASLLIWVFGVPQALEQLPQRAVHSALAIRQMAVAPTAGMPPYPEIRLAVHLGAVRVDSQAPDPVAHLLAVGEPWPCRCVC